MPRTNMCKPSALVQIEHELREFVNGARYMSVADIRRSLGIKDDHIVYKIMEPFAPLVMPSGKRRWKVEDVAKMEHQRTVS